MKVYCFFLLIAIGAIQTALALDIPEIPLEVLVQSPSPIIMLLIDDSSSMNASILASPDNEILSNYFYVFDDPENHVLTSLTSLQTIIPPDQAGSWQARCSGYNRLYYNPHKIYFPWPYWSDIQEELKDKKANLNCPPYHPLKSKCLNLDDPYFTNENISISHAHFFSFDDTNANAILDFDETLFLIELSGKDQLLLVHKIIQPDLGIAKENMEQVSLSQLPESIRLNTSGEPMNYTHQRQNFANWFSFHRRKEFVIKYQMACLVDKVR
ncbi:pilus biosynthesis protein, partial [Candidatus Magnetomorum sp. HK-1]